MPQRRPKHENVNVVSGTNGGQILTKTINNLTTKPCVLAVSGEYEQEEDQCVIPRVILDK